MQTLLLGHTVDVLRTMAPDFFHCIVTSPPYFHARFYKGPAPKWRDGMEVQLGTEPAVASYIEHLSEVVEELRRVLRPDGVMFFNIGDTYNSKTKGLYDVPERFLTMVQSRLWTCRSKIMWVKGISRRLNSGFSEEDEGCNQDDLAFDDDWVGRVSPHPVDGWRWVRHRIRSTSPEAAASRARVKAATQSQGIPRCRASLPESARSPLMVDCPGCRRCEKMGGLVLRKGTWRPAASHEHIFMLVKSPTYYCDRDAIAEPHKYGEKGGACIGKVDQPGSHDGAETHRIDPAQRAHKGGRNARNVWALYEKVYKGAHFAVFPPHLPESCIKVGTSTGGCCKRCHAPFARIEFDSQRWAPTCLCADSTPATPCRVLDPFVGSGTTLLAAEACGRDGWGIECASEYADQISARVPNLTVKEPP
jgi:hypothetical protein